MAWWQTNEPTKPARDRSRSEGAKLLSASYRAYLGRLVPEEDRLKLKLPEGATWADAIAVQTVRRAVALVGKDNICFTAITELRETTEGKTAERVVTGGNEELAALARAIGGPPAFDAPPVGRSSLEVNEDGS